MGLFDVVGDLVGGVFGGGKKDSPTKSASNPTPPTDAVQNALRDIASAQVAQKQISQDNLAQNQGYFTIFAVGGAALALVVVILISNRR